MVYIVKKRKTMINLLKENVNINNILLEIKNLNEIIYLINKYIYEDIVLLSNGELKKIFNFNENLQNFIRNVNFFNLIIAQKKLANNEINNIKKYIEVFNQFIEVNKNILNNQAENQEIIEYQNYLKQELKKNENSFQLVLDNSRNLYKYNEFHEILSKLKNNIINVNVEDLNYDKNAAATKNSNMDKKILNNLKVIFGNNDFIEIFISVGILSISLFLVGTLFKKIINILNSVPQHVGNPEEITNSLFNVILDKNIIFGFFILTILSFLYKSYREDKI